MRKILQMVVLVVCLCTGSGLAAQPRIHVANPATVALADAVVEIPWKTVLQAYPKIDTARMQIVLAKTGQPVTFQLERLGKPDVQNLLVQLSIGVGSEVSLIVKMVKSGLQEPKTYARYVPERYDDFAWENDRIAFRIYGAALNGRSDNAYGTDIWAKRTTALVINKWYKSGDYHKDHGEGLDYYQVGLTLGAGDIGVFLKDSIQFIHNYETYEVLDNGPLRSTFRVTFDRYTFNGVQVNEQRTISLDAGSQLNKVQVRMEHTMKGRLPVVVGITLRPDKSPLLLDEAAGVLGYWEPKHGDDGTLGVGCVFQSPATMVEKYKHGLAKLSILPNETITYYVGGAWDKAGEITDHDTWFKYLRNYAQRIKNKPVFSIER